MSETVAPTRTAAFEARLKQRYAAERRFKALGLAAIVFSVAVLAFLLITMTINGIGGFQRTDLRVTVDFREAALTLDPSIEDEQDRLRSLEAQGLPAVIEFYAQQSLGDEGAAQLGSTAWRSAASDILADPSMLSREEDLWLPARNVLATALSGEGQADLQPLAQRLASEGKLAKRLDPGFLARSDATDPQMVGIWGALKGSMLTMAVTLLLAFPIGVLAALYLEEYAPKNRWTDLIEVSTSPSFCGSSPTCARPR